MIITLVQLIKIISAGGNLVINGSDWTLGQLKEMAKAAGAAGNSTLLIKNIANITPEHLGQIAALAPGKISFELTVTSM